MNKLLCGCQQIDSEFYMKRQKSQNSQLNGLPQWFSGKESACNVGAAGDASSIPGLGRSPGGGHGNPLQYSCQDNPMDRGTSNAAVHGVAKELDTTESAHARARTHTHTHTHTHTDSHTPPHRKLRSHMPCGVAKKKKKKRVQ